jgi:micrococcal nuclease
VFTSNARKAPLWGAFFVLALLAGTATARAGVTVTRVVDGDTVWLADGRHVRLLGINAPELAHGGRPEEPLARTAQERLAALIAGRPVTLRPGRETHDHYGRLLARLELADGRDAGVELVRAGLAVAIAVPPNLAGLDARRKAEAEARHAGRGVWSHPYFRPRAAAGLHGDETGFYFVRGRIDRTGRSRKYIYLDLGRRFALMVPRQDWRYFSGSPSDWVGRTVIARGWAFPRGRGRLGMKIGHPSMMEPVSAKP